MVERQHGRRLQYVPSWQLWTKIWPVSVSSLSRKPRAGNLFMGMTCTVAGPYTLELVFKCNTS